MEKRFLNRITNALGHGHRRGFDSIFNSGHDESATILERIKNRGTGQRRALLDLLAEQAALIKMTVVPVADLETAASSIVRLVLEKKDEYPEKSVVAWKHPLVDGLGLKDRLSEHGILFHQTGISHDNAGVDERDLIKKTVAGAFIGITSADHCIADTGTLVMKTRPGHARSVSLVPSVHVCVVELKNVLADFRELYAVLENDPKEKSEGLTNCMTFITGPSKTADIELVIVHGAHGPREVFLYVVGTGEDDGKFQITNPK